jgi:hypothetical protein
MAGQAPGGWYPQPGVPAARPPQAPPPQAPALPPAATRAARIEVLPGTGFGLAYPVVKATVSGLAVGSMVGGFISILASFAVFCFGLAGAQDGWGVLVSGAFAILAGLVGGAAAASGLVARRQILASRGDLRGRGLAITGIACGSSGLGLALLGFLLAALAQSTSTPTG